ncbi:hypothetical protein CYJ32_07710 [Alloscardovia omnicolens]|uniref:Uncharacterized protein n=1 Tax=Alloscardovia omnicolens TaxID=419015 RepID=A0A2I1M1P0_9BIFI|nr:hypothetical protein [Alloscardovia omnicolens]PKZ14017.1 hypothetical protein CYJ32_07710 [Alloscardovia omnicolens]
MNVFELKSEKIVAEQYYGNCAFSNYPDWLLSAFNHHTIYISGNRLVVKGTDSEGMLIHKFDWLVPVEKHVTVIPNEVFKQLFTKTSLNSKED